MRVFLNFNPFNFLATFVSIGISSRAVTLYFIHKYDNMSYTSFKLIKLVMETCVTDQEN